MIGEKSVMNKTDILLQNHNLQDENDIDILLDLSDYTKQLIKGENYSDINKIIIYTIENSCYEAFSWVMAILQEELEKNNCILKDFECIVGKSIPDYDEFIERLQIDYSTLKNDIKTVCDETGEVQSFFNIFTYRTAFENIFLVSSENFDTKDNDYIQYKLVFTVG